MNYYDNDTPLQTAEQTITDLRRVINRQNRYIAELEKQLEYANPGIVKEIREFLETRGLL